jgi:hypothetical protein
MKTILATVATALLVVACGDTNTGGAASGSAAAKTTASAPAKPAKSAVIPASASPSPSAASADDLATEADFEEEAENEIASDNMEDELAKIEKEVGESK